MSLRTGRRPPDLPNGEEPVEAKGSPYTPTRTWSGRGGRSSLAVSFITAWLLVAAVYAKSPVVTNGDSYLALPAAHSLLYDGNLGLEEFMNVPSIASHYGLETVTEPPIIGVEGKSHPVNYFPWITSIFAVPVLATFDAVSSTGMLHNSRWYIDNDQMDRIQLVSASLVTGLAAAVLALVTRELLLWTRRRTTPDDAAGGSSSAGDPAGKATFGGVDPRRWWFLPAAGLALGLSTSLWSTASRAMWQHGPAVLILALATLAVVRLANHPDSRHRRLWAATLGFGVVMAYWARPPTAALSLGMLIAVAILRRRALLACLAGAAVTMGGVLIANLWLLGRLVPAYYSASRVGIHSHLPEAVLANLISPSRGIFIFSPCLILVFLLFFPGRWSILDQEARVFILVMLSACILYLVSVSGFPHWWGGHSYGPRFMTEAVVILGPLSLLAVLGPRIKSSSPLNRRAIYIVVPILWLVSVAIHFGGAWTDAGGCWNMFPVNVDDQPSRNWAWSDPQALLFARMLLPPADPATQGACDADRQPLF